MCKRKINKIIAIICAVCFFMTGNMIASAQSVNDIEEIDVHSEYLQKFFTTNQEKYVTDNEGNDVTESFFKRTIDKFMVGDIESIFQIMREEELVLHLISTHQVPAENGLYAYDKFKTVRSDIIEFVLSDQYDNTTIYVQAELSGGIWYNEATGEVTNVTDSTYNILSIDCNGSWEILVNDFSTGSNVSDGKGYFWGQCRFLGQGQQNLNGITVTVDLDYGIKKVDFYAIP